MSLKYNFLTAYLLRLPDSLPLFTTGTYYSAAESSVFRKKTNHVISKKCLPGKIACFPVSRFLCRNKIDINQ
jgi:hypothetical protein